MSAMLRETIFQKNCSKCIALVHFSPINFLIANAKTFWKFFVLKKKIMGLPQTFEFFKLQNWAQIALYVIHKFYVF